MKSIQVDDLYRQIGSSIKERRKKSEPLVSQEKLADIVGLSRTSIVNIELGKQHIQIHTLYQIADILGVNALDLLPSSEKDKKVRFTSEQELSEKEKKSIEDIISAKAKKKVNIIE
jgi:transcriptional regulator with XRE-family HTH domain